MNCPRCARPNSDDSQKCAACGADLHPDSDGETFAGIVPVPLPSKIAAAAARAAVATPPPVEGEAPTAGPWTFNAPGTGVEQVNFGPRYKIQRLLGEGGMGAVYKAYDVELDRTVALKLIRPGIASDAAVSARFKQELLLASKISHKNILRIHDLGDAAGVKFISMAYVEGTDLHGLLTDQGKLPLERALAIGRQLCAALEAAHSEGVVHRDFKPQNILLDANDHVYVSDFGLAKSLESDAGMTRSGEMLGTPRYMAPEQVLGNGVDHRVDIYALGLILYEMVTGDVPFHADSTIQLMYKRVHELPPSPKVSNPELPDWIVHVILKAIERDPDQRYQSAAEMLRDLEAGAAPALTSSRAVAGPQGHPGPAFSRSKLVLGAAALVLLIAAGITVWLLRSPRQKAAPGPTVSLAILPFRNASGDASLDWLSSSLADMLTSDVGQSATVRTVSADRLHQILRDLRFSADTTPDPSMLKQIASYSNADRIVVGQFTRLGDQIRLDATLRDLQHERSFPLKAQAPSEKQLVAAIDQLAKDIQQNLALSPASIKEMHSSAFTPTSQSVDALRAYSEGLELNRQGNNLEALKQFQAAVKADPNFALAYSLLGQTYATLGYSKEAGQNLSEAVDLGQNLPPREKYLIIANNARFLNDLDKALQAYDVLLKMAPNDPQVEFETARLYEAKADFDPAKKYLGEVLQRDPKNVDALLAMGRVQIKSGNVQGSLDYLNRALSLAVELGNQQGKANILQALGVAYKMLHKPEDALRNYQESLAIKEQIGDKRGMAASLDEIGSIEHMLGKLDAASQHLQQASKIQREIGDKRGLGISVMDLGFLEMERGHYDAALTFSKECLQIEQEIGSEDDQARCLNNLGVIYNDKGQYDTALTYYKQALQIQEKAKIPADIALALQNLGDTSVRLGQYDQALSYYLRGLDLARNAGNGKLAATISASMGTLFEYQGRYGAALQAREDALKALQQIQDKTRSMVDVESGYGRSLSLLGRQQEADKALGDALALARDLKDDFIAAQVLDYQGEAFFFRGNLQAARKAYEQAVQVSTRAKNDPQRLAAKLGLAEVAVKDKQYAEAITALKQCAAQADTLRLKYYAAVSSSWLAEALLGARKYAPARDAAEDALRQAENLGLRAVQAKADGVLAAVLQVTGNTVEANRRSAQAAQILNEIKQEAHSDAITQRLDLLPASR